MNATRRLLSASMDLAHPWRTLRALPRIDVTWCDLPAGLRAVTDGYAIWMHTGLTQRERRSSLAHELVHIDQGHTSCQPDRIERRVRTLAALWLLPSIAVVADALAWHGDNYDGAADDLWVDEATLRARLDPDHSPKTDRYYVARRLEDL